MFLLIFSVFLFHNSAVEECRFAWMLDAVFKSDILVIFTIRPVLLIVLCVAVLTEGQNAVTKVEIKMSDGKTHISSTIPPDIAHIVSMMSPELLAPPKSVPSQVRSVTALFRTD